MVNFSPQVVDVISPASSRIPQVASNTEAAARMRCATAETLIAEQLSTHVFQDFYISASDEPNLGGLTELLSRLDKKHARKASIARYQIATALEDQQKRDAMISRTVETVRRSLSSWTAEDAPERLRHDLTSFFREASELWQRLRQGAEHAMASASVTSDQWHLDDARQQYDTVQVDEKYRLRGPAWESTLPIAVLFPKIWIGNEILFHGYALFPSQSAVIAAIVEKSQKDMSNGGVKRRTEKSNGTVLAPDRTVSEDKASNTSKQRAQGHARSSNTCPPTVAASKVSSS